MSALSRYSVITPTTGKRPKALGLAIDSVRNALSEASIDPNQVEMLVGFDGAPVDAVRDYPFLRYFSLPYEGHFGNAIRRILIRAAKGNRLLLLDDDNALTPQAFSIYEKFPDAEIIVGRIDVSRAFAGTYLPVHEEGRELIRLANIDPLCLCLSRELVLNRCDGWQVYEGYESDYKNILRYYRRARSVAITESLVGVYDAGMGMDADGLNHRQRTHTATRRQSS